MTETTKKVDGSQTKVVAKKGGTVTTTETDKVGNKTEAEVSLTAAVVAEAQKTEKTVILPNPKVGATKSTETAPALTC